MLSWTFEVRPDDGEPYRVTAHSRDILTWEKAGKGRSLGELANNPSLGAFYGLAYFAARRQGLFTGTLAEFEQQVDLEPLDDDEGDEEAPDPTRPGPSAEPSSTLPSSPASPPPSGQKRAGRRS